VEPSTEDLIAAISTSPDALDLLYRRHIDGVVRFLATRCRTPEDVADAAASTFLAVLRSSQTFQPERGNGERWLFVIAGNEARRLQRKGIRRDELLLRLRNRTPLNADDTERIAEMIDAERAASLLAPLLQTVRPSERSLLDRMVIDDVTSAEASRDLGIDPAAGRRRLARLRSSIRTHLDRAPDPTPDSDRSEPSKETR
jgi:RNA polymerase sigma factor (sigma-70 family)